MSKLLRLRIGPTFLIALVLSGLLLWWKHERDQQRRGPVIVEHQTVATPGTVGAVPPDFVRERAEKLELSAGQRGKVGKLAEEWEQETAGLRQRLDAAAAALQGKLGQAPPAKLTAGDYQAEAGEVQALSRELSERRQAYWTRLLAVLNADQQRQAQEAWVAAHRIAVPPPPKEAGGGR